MLVYSHFLFFFILYISNTYFFKSYIFVKEVIYLNNMDMAKLMSMLAKMDKKDLEEGLAKATKILNSKDKDKIINNLNDLNNK
jgi:hypothetical protein